MPDDDDAQVDGDWGGPEPFATSMRGAPWLRGGPSPWHLWGNTQQLVLPPNPFTVDDTSRIFLRSTLVRVAYGRPECWRYMVRAVFLEGPTMGPGNQAQINISYEVLSGIGRSVVPFTIGQPRGYVWGLGTGIFTPPVGIAQWSSMHDSGYEQLDLSDPPLPNQVSRSIPIDNFVGQDFTIVARCNFVTDLVGNAPALIEVSCQVAPTTHVRPDWFQVDADRSVQFSGDEVGAR